MKLSDALAHPYFAEVRDPEVEFAATTMFDETFEALNLNARGEHAACSNRVLHLTVHTRPADPKLYGHTSPILKRTHPNLHLHLCTGWYELFRLELLAYHESQGRASFAFPQMHSQASVDPGLPTMPSFDGGGMDTF